MDTIAPEIARKLLNRDFANLAQRVQRGGKLNRAESAMLQGMVAGKVKASNAPWPLRAPDNQGPPTVSPVERDENAKLTEYALMTVPLNGRNLRVVWMLQTSR